MKTINISISKNITTPVLLILFIFLGLNYEAKSQIIPTQGNVLVESIVNIGKFAYEEKIKTTKTEKTSIFKYNLNILKKSFELYTNKLIKKLESNKVKITEKKKVKNS